MSESTPQSVPPQGAPAPAGPPAKSGVHPLVWVGIGCAGLVVLVLGGCAVMVWLSVGHLKAVSKQISEVVQFDPSSGTMTLKNPTTGESVSVSGGATLPADFPTSFPVYAGAEIAGSQAASASEGSVMAVVWTTGDAANTVSEWYRDALGKAGYTVSTYTSMPAGSKMSLKVPGNEKGECTLVISSGDDMKTSIVLFMATPKAAGAAVPAADDPQTP